MLIGAFGKAGGVEVDGLPWVMESSFLHRGQEAAIAATTAPGHRPPRLISFPLC